MHQLERELRSYRPQSLQGSMDLPDEFVWPRYGGRCVGNLAQTAAGLLGAELPGALPALDANILGDLTEGVKRVVLLVMDAMGWLQLQRVMAQRDDLIFHSLAEKGRLIPITTTFLSTTNSVLSTIWSGHPPLEHGLLGFELYLREWMMAVEAIGFSSVNELFANTLLKWGFEPEKFLAVPSVGQVLGPQGVSTVSVIHKNFTTTPLSRMHFRGADEVRGHSYASDLWVALRQALMDYRGKRLLLGGYWPAVDTLAHKYGPDDETAEAEMRAISMLMETLFLEQLEPEDRDGTLLLFTADHGQMRTPASETAVLDDHPQLRDMLWMAPVGESRVPFFYTRNGQTDAAWEYLEGHFGDQFVFVSREQILQSGLLGPGKMYAEVPYRLGDITGIAKGPHAFSWDQEDAERLLGRHGGLTPEEMLVPLLAARLDA